MAELRKVQVGDAVIYCDEKGKDHNALVQAVHGVGDEPHCCINVMFVSGDSDRQDSHGRQTEHPSSVMRSSADGVAHGYYWRFSDEPRIPYRQPQT